MDWDRIKEITPRLARYSYFILPDRLLEAAHKLKLDPAPRRLLVFVVGERRRNRRAVSLGEKSYVPCNGGTTRGYKVATWMERAGFKVALKGTTDRRSFVAALQRLTETFALQIVVDGVTTDTSESLSLLARVPRSALRLGEWDARQLQLFLPEDLPAIIDEIAPAASRALAEARSADRHQLDAWVRDFPGGQSTAARALGVSPSSLSRYLGGTRKVPVSVLNSMRSLPSRSS